MLLLLPLLLMVLLMQVQMPKLLLLLLPRQTQLPPDLNGKLQVSCDWQGNACKPNAWLVRTIGIITQL